MTRKLKVIFMGTPSFAVPILEMLNKETEVVLVVTQPDKFVGRKQILTPSPIKEFAQKSGLKIFQPSKIKEDYSQILQTECDVIITCAYGQILPKEILEYPKLHCINVHASLLPKYRGGAPIHWCLINGEEKTGITIMYMSAKMDAGDILSQKEYQIKNTDTVETLHEILSKLGAETLQQLLPAIQNNTLNPIPQDESKVTFGYNITREDEHLDFHKKGIDLVNQIRGLNSWPLANFKLNNQEIKVYEAYFTQGKTKECGQLVDLKKDAIGISCQDGILYLTKIKPFGKKKMAVKEYLNGVSKEDLFHATIN